MQGVIPGALALAFLIEGLVEYVIGLWWKPGSPEVRAKIIPAINIVLGIALAIGFRLDLLVLLGLPAGLLGQAITGAAIGRGSQYLHGFVNKFLNRS